LSIVYSYYNTKYSFVNRRKLFGYQPEANVEIFIYLTPLMHPKKSLIFQGTRFIPLSFKGEGEEIFERGQSPLSLHSPFPN
jgi:hypothetical protein